MDGAGLPGKGEPLEADFLSGGTQNVIYRIGRGEDDCVLRMPPPGAPPDRDKGILREWRIIEALDGTEVPHTAAIGVCSDASVLGRPFYLMGFVDGWSPMDLDQRRWPDPFDTDLGARQGLGVSTRRGHRVVVEGGLEGEGPATISVGPTAFTNVRSTGGSASSSGSRAGKSRAWTWPPNGCAPTARSISSPD